MHIDSNPQWFFYTAELLTVLFTPFNILTLYIIIRCPFDQTNKVKKYMVCFQFFAILTDVHNVFGFLPVFYSPFVMFSSNGMLTKLVNYEAHYDFSISQIFMVLKCGCIEQLFFMIYQGVLPPNHPCKLRESKCIFRFIVSNIIWIISTTTYYYYILPNQENIKAQFSESHSHLKYLIENRRVTILSIEDNIFTHFFYAIIIGRSFSGILQSGYSVWKCREVFEYYPLLSRRTIQIKKRFVKTLSLQIGLPIFVFYTPLIIAMIASQFEFFRQYSQTITLVCLIIILTHTFFGSLSLFLVPGSYQNWMLGELRGIVKMYQTPDQL